MCIVHMHLVVEFGDGAVDNGSRKGSGAVTGPRYPKYFDFILDSLASCSHNNPQEVE